MSYLPKKCGEMYIKFNKNGTPQYGFKVNEIGNSKYYSKEIKIIEFINLTDEIPKQIVLPAFDHKHVPTSDEELNFVNWYDDKNYFKGLVRVCDGCFKNIDEATIIVPNNTSIMLDWGCFKDNSKINFSLPKNMGIKHIFRGFSTSFDWEHEEWTLLADKRLNVNISDTSDSYTCQDFKTEFNRKVKFYVNNEPINESFVK